MNDEPEERRALVRCRNCGEIMTGTVTQAGELVPVGVDNDGKCGDADFEVLTMRDADESRTETV